MTLKTSLIITGDASVARKEVEDLTRAIGATAAGTKAAVAPATELDAAQKRAAASARAEAAAAAAAGAAIEKGARSARDAATAATALGGATATAGRGAKEAALGVAALDKATAATARSTAELIGIGNRLDSILAAIQQGTLGAAAGHASLRDAITASTAANAGFAASTTSATASAEEQATAEHRLAQATSDAERSAAAAALAALKLKEAQDGSSGAAARMNAEMEGLRASLDPAGEAQRRLAAQIDIANTALARGVITQDQYDAHLKKLNTTTNEAAEASTRHSFGVRNLGQQVGDFATQVSLGGGVIRSFSSQAGQMGYALSEMGGTAGKVGAFLTGPWGIALTVAALAVGPLIEALTSTKDKTKDLQKTEEEYAQFQGNLANFIDAANGKLRDRVGLLAQIAVQEGKANITKSDKEVKDLSGQAFAAAREGAKRIVFGAGSAGIPIAATVIDPAVQKAIDSAGGSVLKLRDNLNALAKTQPSVQATADKVNTLAGQALFAFTNSAKLKAGQAELNTALHGGTIESAALIERQVALQTATNGVEKAQARLNDVKAQGASIDKELFGPKKIADLARYKTDLLGATNALKSAQDAAKDANKAATSAFLTPVSGGRITTRFGQRESGRGEAGSHVHQGVDYAVPVGTPVRAPAAGTVDVAGSRQGYGNAIYINFGGGTQARFGHLSKFNVKPGDVVNAGDVIGYTGGAAGAAGSGDSTGPHLHYEVRRNGRSVNPTTGRFPTDAGQAGDTAQKLQDAADKKHTEALARQADLLRSSGNTIESINASWGDQATLVARAVAPTNQLSDLIDKLNKQKPPGFEKLIADAEAAKIAIQDGIQRPYNDFLEEQAAQIGQLALIRRGRQDEADALNIIVGLERQQGPLTLAQKDAVLATVQARKAEQREIDVLREKNQKYLDAIGDIKSAVQDATQAFVRGDLGQFIKTPGKLLDAFNTLQGQALFDKLFDGVFRDLQDQINGTSTVKDASNRMAAAVDHVSSSAGQATSAIDELARASSAAAGAVAAGGAGSPSSLAALLDKGNGVVGPTGSLAELLSRGNGVTGPGPGGESDIVVNASRRGSGTDPTALFTRAIGGIGTSVASVFTNKDNAQAFGANVGKYGGAALSGAATGSLVSGIGKSLGIGLSSGGSQFGGALGGILGSVKGITASLGPFGAALTPVLSIFGGLVGKLFAPKARPGGVTVGSVDGTAARTGTSGSDKKLIAASGGLGDSVSGGINKIVEQLGGTLGQFSVSIGKYKDDLRVNVNGKALGGVKNSGAVGFGNDENAAVSYAAAQAIAQGAIQGVSAAVSKALKSSPDIDKALKEALKVQDLELTIGGIGAQIDKAFRDFETTAKERVRVASQYGFDVVAIEKRNGEDRVKLADQLLKQQVGSLQSLVDELTQGSLFEGSAIDHLAAINAAIAKAKADLDAGVDGAADKLATLYQNRLATSKDAYGTTKEYAVDRASTLDEARAAVAAANARIVAAQAATAGSSAAQATTVAVVAGNALVNETNDLLAIANARLDQIAGLLPIAAITLPGQSLDLTGRQPRKVS